MTKMLTDWEIAQSVVPRPIIDLARDGLGIPAEAVEPYGHYKAKIGMDFVAKTFAERSDGKLICDSHQPHACGRGQDNN